MQPTANAPAFQLTLDGDARMHCAIDDFTDPWLSSDAVLMIHGIAEQGDIWKPWVPRLARRHRVLRPDLRGFGRSSPLPADRPFSVATWHDDLVRLVETLCIERVHLVATKLGAQVAFALAEKRPAWLASMTLAGMLPSPKAAVGGWLDAWIATIRRDGVEAWARETMPGRMGSGLSGAAMAWWTATMGQASPASTIACLAALAELDGPSHPEAVDCPTLFVVASGSPDAGAAYAQRPSSEALMRLIDRVPGAIVGDVPADSFHIAATHPDDCARLAADFIANTGSRVAHAAHPVQ